MTNEKEYGILLDAKQAKVYLGVCKTQLYALAKTEGFPTVKIGSRLYFNRDKLQEWADNSIGK